MANPKIEMAAIDQEIGAINDQRVPGIVDDLENAKLLRNPENPNQLIREGEELDITRIEVDLKFTICKLYERKWLWVNVYGLEFVLVGRFRRWHCPINLRWKGAAAKSQAHAPAPHGGGGGGRDQGGGDGRGRHQCIFVSLGRGIAARFGLGRGTVCNPIVV
ncbi:hypothetical protein COLO4_25575 [Corchorus olitorius]|uniref:Uncharacterized protein n=1 Tax=Corchorus olitorius TaxID=93759 RepID=A0A1R3I1E5_9ROSI|nr:hypothetical protein COLO4_25575 [Corchorus olitorius]